MYSPEHIHGLDIETDNSAGHGLDPYHSVITEIAIANHDGGVVLSGPEPRILSDLEQYMNDIRPGLIVTWNGLFFDNPFIKLRAELGEHSVQHAMDLLPQDGLKPKYDFLPGVTAAQSFIWKRSVGAPHAHLDISFAWRAFAESFGVRPDETGKLKPVVPWSLKPVAKAAGIEMVEIDRTRLHDYTSAEVGEYCLSDARGTRLLALKTLGLA